MVITSICQQRKEAWKFFFCNGHKILMSEWQGWNMSREIFTFSELLGYGDEGSSMEW